MPFVHESLSFSYYNLFQYDNVIPGYEKALQIFKKWWSKPSWIFSYTQLGVAYHKTGQFKKEKKIYRKAKRDFPYNEPEFLQQQEILALSEGKTKDTNEYIAKYKSIRKGLSFLDREVRINPLFLRSSA